MLCRLRTSCAQPRIWGRLHGSLLYCLRKDVALMSHCVPGLGRETGTGAFWRRHISCALSNSSIFENDTCVKVSPGAVLVLH